MARGLMFESKGKIGKAWRWSVKRGGAHCDACGAECGAWADLLKHLGKRAIPQHAGMHEVLDAQAERVSEVVEALRHPHRKAA